MPNPQDLFFYASLALAGFLVLRFVLAARNRITGSDARAKVEAGAQLLDVRSPAEFRAGAIPGAKNISVQALSGRLKELAKDKPVVVYCASGMRSASAVSILKQGGYEAYDLGPASAW